MLKKTITLALAAMAVLAVSAPAASATWFKHHNAIQQNETIQLTGQWKKESIVVGSVECKTQMKLQLLAAQTTAEVEELAVDAGISPTTRCIAGSPLHECDVTSFSTDATTQAPWVAHLLAGNRDTIEVTTGIGQTRFEGVNATIQGQHTACNVVQSIQLKPGKVHLTIPAGGSTCTIQTLSLSGQLETQTGAKVQITGTQEVKPGGTYGTKCP